MRRYVEMVAPLEAVFKEDSPIDKLYVIQQGLVGCKSRVLHPGQPFGGVGLVAPRLPPEGT